MCIYLTFRRKQGKNDMVIGLGKHKRIQFPQTKQCWEQKPTKGSCKANMASSEPSYSEDFAFEQHIAAVHNHSIKQLQAKDIMK